MKLDAPYETGFDKSQRLELIDFLVEDLALPASAYDSVRSAFTSFPRDRPLWQQLAPVGGTVGALQATLASEDYDVRLLLGDDPVGWLGLDYIAGTWLVRWAPAIKRSAAAKEQNHDAESLERFFDRMMLLASATGAVRRAGVTSGAVRRAGMATGVSAAGLTALSPVLGGAVGIAMATAAARQMARKRAATKSGASETAGVSQEDGVTAAELTATIAESMGRHWVRVEASKVVALYRTFPPHSGGDKDVGLPSLASARAHLLTAVGTLEEWHGREVAASGTKSHDRNERLRELADIRDTLVATAEALG